MIRLLRTFGRSRLCVGVIVLLVALTGLATLSASAAGSRISEASLTNFCWGNSDCFYKNPNCSWQNPDNPDHGYTLDCVQTFFSKYGFSQVWAGGYTTITNANPTDNGGAAVWMGGLSISNSAAIGASSWTQDAYGLDQLQIFQAWLDSGPAALITEDCNKGYNSQATCGQCPAGISPCPYAELRAHVLSGYVLVEVWTIYPYNS